MVRAVSALRGGADGTDAMPVRRDVAGRRGATARTLPTLRTRVRRAVHADGMDADSSGVRHRGTAPAHLGRIRGDPRPSAELADPPDLARDPAGGASGGGVSAPIRERQPLFGLTLKQPWAACVAHHHKRVENRTWRPPDGCLGTWVAIHAGAGTDTSVDVTEILAEPIRDRRIHGAIVALARVDAVIERASDLAPSQRRWWRGPFGWVLGAVRTLHRPIACGGGQGLWLVSHAHRDAIGADLASARRRTSA